MSDQSRRKLLKSIAAGSGAIVAGKSLPESWTKPVVDSVLLPVHAQTSQICTIDLRFEFNISGDGFDGGYGFDISNFPVTASPIEEDSVGVTSSTTRTFSFALPPGQYILDGGSGGNTDGATTAFGRSVVSCCSDSFILGEWSLETNDGDGDGAEALVTIGADGTCQIGRPPALSDIRLKTNIEALSISREGYNLYKFQYIDENNENTYVGVMAQDVISSNPEAVIQNESGFYMVRYDQLGLKMVTLKQWESEGPDSVELMH